jgi:polyhydroxybutyrate depolymerase
MAAAVLVVLSCGAAFGQEIARYDDLEVRAIVHEGAPRRVGLYVPSTYNANHPAPLLVALHGRFSSAQAFHALSGLTAVAEARGAIVVYPETIGAFWNDGGHAALHRMEAPAGDEGLIAAVVAAVRAEYAIDAERVFLVGYDTGGGMAYRLACRGSQQWAGVAVVSALMWDYAASACGADVAPTPMLIVHGRRDDIFPAGGGAVGAPLAARRLGVNDTLALWRRINGCASAADMTGRNESAVHTSCSSGSAVAYVGVAGGEHDWFRTGPGYQLNRMGVDAATLIDGFFFNASAFALPTERASDDRARSYIVYAPPSYDADQPMPAVILLHGRPDNASGMALTTEMNAVAARRGFIVVYPDGVNNEWNAIHDLTGRRSVAPQDDIAFLETLMEDLRVDLNIDPRRMYVGGFSNGGFMTLRMACSSSGHFAAFASVGAELYTALTNRCRGAPAPVMFIHGTADRSVPYTGVVVADGQGREPTHVSLSVQESVAFFIRRNRCSMSGVSMTLAERGFSPQTHVIRFAPHDCAPGADVLFYLVNGGGHNWPGVTGVLNEERMGPTNMDINAGEVIWDFFSSHALAEAPAAR